MRALWNDHTIAASEDTVLVEGNHYFPSNAVDRSCLEDSDHTTTCGWKGTARYYHVVVNGERNENAAWYYPEPFDAARRVRGRIAFWKGVQVAE